jgi:acyl carrier protein
MGRVGMSLQADLAGLLAEVTGRPELSSLPTGAGLFAEAGLDSLHGTLLLRAIRARYGVDVAADDLNLDALATLETLAAFIAAHGQGDPA